jgi:excisionase family DNA binding protein
VGTVAEPEKLLTTGQAAEVLQVHPKTLYGWVQSKQIPFVRLGRRAIRFRPSQLDAFAADREDIGYIRRAGR